MELFKLLGTIAIDNAEARKALQDVGKDGQEAESKLGKVFSGIGKGAAVAGATIATGLAAGATACVGLATAAIKSYADYEQLLGGAQLLFGDAFGYVEEQAKNSYKTVQMSQNEYLQQVNGFSTGLKTALGGNEQAAAELAHKIIVAEADVVAATGNSAEAVQNAFNGIMKSNFTMLDNLQLGITPTKEGFQEVIDKVNEWNAANGEATSYQISNLADCQSALVDYIEMQGLAGYAANEAAGTISGSISMLKGAWSNLITGIADENQDFSTLMQAVFDSAMAVWDNIEPRLGVVFEGIALFVEGFAAKIVEFVPGLIEQVLPIVLEGAARLISAIVSTLPEIIAAVGSALQTAFESLLSSFGMTEEGIQKVKGAIEGIIETVGVATIVFAGFKAGMAIQSVVQGFQSAQVAISLLSMEVGKANLAQAALNGTMKISETIVALLTGKMTLASLAQAAMSKAQAVLNAVMAANPIMLIVTACAALVAAIGLVVYKLLDEEKAIKSTEQAQKDLTAAKEEAKNAENSYIDAVDRSEEALKKLEEAEKAAGLSGQELAQQVQSGALDYADMNQQQKEVYKAYLENEEAQKNLAASTEELNAAKKAETIAAFENQLALAAESGEYDAFKQSVVEAFNSGQLSAAEARDLLGASMSEMSASAQKTFMEDIPGAVKEGLNPSDYQTTLQQMSTGMGQAWESTKSAFSDMGSWFSEKFKGAKEASVNAWSDTKEKFNNVKNKCVEAFSDFKDKTKTKFSEAKEAASNAWSDAKSKFSSVKDKVVEGFSDLKDKVKTKFNDAKTNAENAWSDAQSKFSNVKEKVVSAFSDLGSKVKSKFSTAKTNAESAWANAQSTWKSISDKVANGFSGLGGKLKTKFSSALETAKQGFSKASSIGKDLVEGIWKGISGAYDWITGKIKGWVGNVTDFIKNLFGIKSPSTVMRDEVGRELARGIAVGIEKNTNEATDAMKALAEDVVATAKETIANGGTEIADAVSGTATTSASTALGDPGRLDARAKVLGKTRDQIIKDGFLSEMFALSASSYDEVNEIIKVLDDAEYKADVTFEKGFATVYDKQGKVLWQKRQEDLTEATSGMIARENAYFELKERLETGYYNDHDEKFKASLVEQLNRDREFIEQERKLYGSQIEYFRSLDTGKLVKNIGTVAEGTTQKITDANAKLNSEIVKTAKTKLATYKQYNNLTAKAEAEYWDEIRTMFEEGTEARIEADKEYYAAKSSIDKELLDSAKKQLENHKVYNEMTLAEEAGFWDEIRQQFEEGTDARIEADKSYFAAKKSYNEKILSAEQKLQDDLDAIAQKEKDRQKDILETYDLFGSFVAWESGIDPATELLMRLDEQIDHLGMYDDAMGNLEDRIGGTALFEELKNMDVDDADKLKLIADMTDAELQSYVKKFDELTALAGKTAKEELAPETMADTAKAYEDFAKSVTEAGGEIVDSFASNVTSTVTAVADSFGEIAQAYGDFAASCVENGSALFEGLQQAYEEFVANTEGFDASTFTASPMLSSDSVAYNINSGNASGSDSQKSTSGTVADVYASVMEQKSMTQKLLDMLGKFFPELIEAFNIDLFINDRVLAAELAPAMNEELGILSSKKERGR